MPVKIGKPSIDLNPGSPSQANSVDTKKSEVFSSQLKEVQKNHIDQDLKTLINEVKELGEKLLRSPEEKLLGKYKTSIKNFLGKISKDFLSLKEEFGAKHEGEQKVYQLVNLTESEVESITAEAFNDKKAVNLLASLDDIRGLVLDIIG